MESFHVRMWVGLKIARSYLYNIGHCFHLLLFKEGGENERIAGIQTKLVCKDRSGSALPVGWWVHRTGDQPAAPVL
jgi:hypothetical protein